ILIYRKITKLLANIELSNCDNSEVKELSNLLKEKLDRMLKNNGDPYFIINLIQQRKDDFSDLYKTIRRKVSEDQKDYIDIQLGNTNKEEKVIIDSIRILEERLRPSHDIQIIYSNDPLAVIVAIIKNLKTENLITLLNENFIPLVIKVLSSDTSLVTKESYLEALITLLVEYKKEKKVIPSKVKKFFLSNQIDLKGEFTFSKASVISAKYYINTINSLLNIDTENTI